MKGMNREERLLNERTHFNQKVTPMCVHCEHVGELVYRMDVKDIYCKQCGKWYSEHLLKEIDFKTGTIKENVKYLKCIF